MTQDIGTQIIEKAKSFGASLAGITSVELVKKSPSYELHEKILEGIDGVGAAQGFSDLAEIKWPEGAKSVLVLALHHPHDKPELDWYLESGHLPGNEILMEIKRKLRAWIEKTYGIKTHHVNYWIWEGGKYLKDAAVLSGLGCLGKNNLVITPEFGPRVRFRAMLIDEELTPTGPIDFDPCNDCDEYCHKACGVNAFSEIVISADNTGMSNLPERIGNYSQVKCYTAVDANDAGIAINDPVKFYGEKKSISKKEMGTYQTQKYIMFCIRCIEACPVGN
jgi:epoxyqueuosine reductase